MVKLDLFLLSTGKEGRGEERGEKGWQEGWQEGREEERRERGEETRQACDHQRGH